MNKTILKTLVIIVFSLAIGFFAGIEYKAYQVRSALKEATKEISDIFSEPSQQNIPTSEKQEDYVWIEKNIGDEIELATLRFKVNKIEEKQIISSQYGTPKVAKEGAKFVVIDLELTNITNAPFYFSNLNGFILIDDKKRQFAEYEDVIGSIDNYLVQRKLSPNITEKGVFVYEIPNDATSYGLAIGKAGTNEAYKVILK